MTPLEAFDLERRIWATRREAARARVRLSGLALPVRDPAKRACLAERGAQLFAEDEAAGEAARRYYARKYTRPEA